IQHHRLPIRNETPEYYSPPLYYALAGAVTWIGRQIGMGEPHKLGQLLNVPVVIATVLLVAALARLLWPTRRWAAPAAAAFVALWERPDDRRALLRAGLVAAAVCVLVAGPWYGYRVHHYANPLFDRPHSSKPLLERRPARFYLDPGAPGVFTHPYRPHLKN